jgi:hypothetical protein
VTFNSIARSTSLSFLLSVLLFINGKGQDVSDPHISFKVTNLPLAEALKILESKTNLTFSYLNKELPLEEKITFDVKDKTLEQICDMLSGRYGITFSRINNIITIKKPQAESSYNQSLTGTLRGVVQDSLTGEVMPFASVYLSEKNFGATTDTRGFFVILSLPARKEYTVIVTFVGYATKKVKVFIQENKINQVKILLNKNDIELEGVTVTGERLRKEDVTVLQIQPRDIQNRTFGVEADVMRTIQLEAGVQSAGDVSAKYYVRGGASNENLVLLNGTPIYNPFHALGIFSVIDPEMINSLEFYKGGFGAKYDGRLSSVTNIVTKDGNKNNFGASAAISQLTAKSSIEGPIPNGSFIITGRKSISNEVLKKFTNNESIPIDFYDASFKVSYSLPEELSLTKFSLYGFISKDVIDYDSQLHAKYNWQNSHIGFNLFSARQNEPVYGEFSIYYSKFSGSELPNDAKNSRSIVNGVDDLTIKTNYNFTLGNRNEFYLGARFYNLNTKLTLSNSTGKTSESRREGSTFISYLGFKLLSLENLKVDGSFVLNVLNMTEGTSRLEPRLNALYSLLPALNLKFAWGIYQQELVTLSDEDEILSLFEPWVITPKYLKPSSAIHYIGGIDYYLTDKCKITVEGFFKAMHNLAVLNDEVVYPTDDQLLSGSGKSYGGEATINYQNRWMNTQISYSYSNTTKKVNDIEYHPRYDSRNNVKVFINFELGKDWRAGLCWTYSSGMPFTQIFGYYYKFNPLSIFQQQPLLSNDYQFFPYKAERNAANGPDYHRLDINFSKSFQFWSLKMSIDVNFVNIYDRKNFFYYDIITGNRVNMLPFFPSIDIRAAI